MCFLKFSVVIKVFKLFGTVFHIRLPLKRLIFIILFRLKYLGTFLKRIHIFKVLKISGWQAYFHRGNFTLGIFQTFKNSSSLKTVLETLVNFAKNSIIDVLQDSKYASDLWTITYDFHYYLLLQSRFSSIQKQPPEVFYTNSSHISNAQFLYIYKRGLARTPANI